MRGKKYLLSVLCLLLIWTTPVMADSTTISGKVRQIVDEVITPDMSQLDKAFALHDWLTDHAYYDLPFPIMGQKVCCCMEPECVKVIVRPISCCWLK